MQQRYGGVECWMSEFTVIETPRRNLNTSCTPSTYLHASSQRNAGMPHESSPPAMVTWRAGTPSTEPRICFMKQELTRCFDLKFQSDSPLANNFTTAFSKRTKVSLHYLQTLRNKGNTQSWINPAFAKVPSQVLKGQIKLAEALLSEHFQTFFLNKNKNSLALTCVETIAGSDFHLWQ